MPLSPEVRRLGFTSVADGKDGSDEPAVIVIFIHGPMGSPQNTWSKSVQGKKDEVFCWPKDGLPKKLPKAQILLYGYDADVLNLLQSTPSGSITHHANNLLASLKTILPKDNPIIFVCHSLGGILVKDVLEQSRSSSVPDYRRVHANTSCVVFMGTPHRGSAATSIGQIATRIAKAFLLNPNENIPQNVIEQWSELLGRIHYKFMPMLIKPDFDVHCFQEDRGGMGISGLIVDRFSSTTGSPFETCETLTASHMDMVAYDGPTDPNYQKVSDTLMKYYQKIISMGIVKLDATPRARKQNSTPHPVIDPHTYFGDLEHLETEIAGILCTPALADSIHRETSFSTIEAASQATIETTLSKIAELISNIIRGFVVLREAGYCQEDFTLVIQVPDASNVVRLTPISFHCLQQLSELISLALGEVESKKGLVQECTTILDIGEAAAQIFSFFGFEFPHPNSHDASVRYFTGLLQMLSFGLVSYAGSHTSNTIGEFIHGRCLHFRILIAQSESPIIIFFHPVTLACLNQYVGGPVWSFSQTNPDSMNDSRKTVLTSIRSFVDLWGPARIIYSDPERSIVSKIQTERGTIGRRTSKSKVGGAVDCHWFSWDEFIPPDIEPFEEGSRLAIGAHLGHEMHFDVRSRSTCSTPKETTGAILKNTSSSEELGLIPDSWVLDAINFTLGISKGFVGNLGGVVKRIPGRSRKGLLLLEWASENPDPLTLKARIGLEISGCTGNALRLPLWELLRLDSVKDYVRRVLPNYLPKTFTGVPSFLDAFDRGFDNFMRLWVQNDEFRKSTVIIVRKLLQSLAFTGLKKGDLSAWFIDKPGGLLIRNCNQHNWLKLLADSDGEACLAVISRRCLQCACSDVVKCGATSMELHTALWTKINLEVQNDQQIDLHSRNHELQRRKVCYGSELPAHSDDDFQQSAFLSAALSKILLRHKPTDASSLIGLSTDPTAIPSSPITDRGDTPITNPAASVMSPNVGDATTLDEDAGSSSTIMATVYDLRGHKRIIMPRLCNESTNKVPAVKLEKSMLGWLTPFLAKGLGANSYSYREVTELETVDSQSIQVCFR